MSSLIITHWDTDGILSAAAVAGSLNHDITLYIPAIGTYSLPDEDISEINANRYQEIFITDYALQKEIAGQLQAEKTVVIIDHHFTEKAEEVEYYNPVADGADPDRYPCCMVAVSEYLEKEFPLETCIAAVGDKEHKIKKNRYFADRLERCKQEYGMGFDDCMELKELIDANYMTGDISGIKDTIRAVIQMGVLSLRDSEALKEKVRKAVAEKERLSLTSPEKKTENIWFYDLASAMPLLSAVTRLLSKNHPDKIIVTRLNGNVYVRTERAGISLKPLISKGRSMGWNIGGKPDVCGIAGCSRKALDNVFEYLTTGI